MDKDLRKLFRIGKIQICTRLKAPCLGFGINFEDIKHPLVWLNFVVVSFYYAQ